MVWHEQAAVLPAMLPNGNAQASTGRHERPRKGPLTWTGRHEAAQDGQGNTSAVRLIIRRSEVQVLPAPPKTHVRVWGTRTSDRARDQVSPRVGSTCSASAVTVGDPDRPPGETPVFSTLWGTPDRMAHLRWRRGIRYASWGWSAGQWACQQFPLDEGRHSPRAPGRLLSSSSGSGQVERLKETCWSCCGSE